jgi:hypothetical protein
MRSVTVDARRVAASLPDVLVDVAASAFRHHINDY